MNKRVNIVGFQVDSLTMPEAVAWVEKRIAKRTPSHIVTINPEIAWNGLQDKEFGRALKKADLLVPDGSGILWAARQLGQPLPERVAGYDLMQEMLRVAAEKKIPYLFFRRGTRCGRKSGHASTDTLSGSCGSRYPRRLF